MTSAHFANSPPTHSENSQLNNKSSTSFTAIANSCFSFNASAITFTLP